LADQIRSIVDFFNGLFPGGGRENRVENYSNQKTLLFKPTYNISGNLNTETDLESTLRRVNRDMGMELKQKGAL
jgi:hypothetical protein